MSGDTAPSLRRDFRARADLVDYLRRVFPDAVACADDIAPTQGGRSAAETALARLDPAAYTATRNFLTGAVTRLSPYLRHGVVSLAEVRDAALHTSSPQTAAKLINELGWRDYYRRVYSVIGRGVWRDLEPYQTGWQARDYAADLPADIATGATGLACIDAFSHDLRTTGYLHNHARMWLAAYVVHFRRVRWQAGARWFLTHLLDGDPASNNLSWQWVASTFSHKPYFFNRANLEKYTDGVYCAACPLRGRCDFEGDYAALEQRLFPHREMTVPATSPTPLRTAAAPPARAVATLSRPIVWLHGDNLNPHSPARRAFPAAPAVWVWDDARLAHAPLSLKRIVFLYECLLELPVTIQRGEVADTVLRFAAAQHADGVITNATPAPGFAAIRQRLEQTLPVVVLPEDAFVTPPAGLDLRRFSRYWRKVEAAAMQVK